LPQAISRGLSGLINIAESPVTSGKDAVLAVTTGQPKVIASKTGNPKPS
jgi:hypothetical protein